MLWFVVGQTCRSPAISASSFEASSFSAVSMALVRPSALLIASSASEAVTAITLLMPCTIALSKWNVADLRWQMFKLQALPPSGACC